MSQVNKIVIAIILGSIIIGGFMYWGIQSASEVVKNNDLTVGLQDSAVKLQEVKNSQCKASENTVVTKVIDGDTVVVEGGYHVRLLEMDADEKNYPCYESAKTRLEQLILNKQVFLEKDISDIDKYGRCLRTIFIGSENTSLKLVKEGLAVARFYEPDIKYKSEIQAAEQQAIENRVGCKLSK